ncbi:sialidase family protein [Denitratisoma sp. DHT3]|uniref:sialidase family protein n=1 Tax=Denitratisoma sp. DHT3 TaxID=1981880 RepID=UPI0016444576|nr:YCF48-related protein [Denitratisoma sp. DHT3]
MSQRVDSGAVVTRLIKLVLSVMPWLIIAGLLWAGLFIKPKSVGAMVAPPVMGRGDAFFGLAAPASKQLWAVGNFGKIIHSIDDGATWSGQGSCTASHLQDIAAWDAKHLLAVGNGGMVCVTEDGGGLWSGNRLDFLPASTDKLLRVKAVAGGGAWAVGEMGALLYSGDYGKTWERRRAVQDTAFNDVAFADEKNGWVVGEAGGILRTTDGGRTWEAAPSGVRSSLMGVAFRDARNGVAVGLEGVILTTADAGRTWRRVAAGRRDRNGADIHLHFYDIAWDAQRNRWFAVGDQGVFATADGESSAWSGGPLAPQELAWHTRIVAADGQLYLAGGSLGRWTGEDASWHRLGAGN